MPKAITTQAITGCQPAVIWQPYTEESGTGEPAILVQSDACGLLVIEQEGRCVLVQRETVPELIKQLKRIVREAPTQ